MDLHILYCIYMHSEWHPVVLDKNMASMVEGPEALEDTLAGDLLLHLFRLWALEAVPFQVDGSLEELVGTWHDFQVLKKGKQSLCIFFFNNNIAKFEHNNI